MVAFGHARDDGYMQEHSPAIRAYRMVFLFQIQLKRRTFTMKKTTVKGTRDYLPREAELREFMQRRIFETYRDAGFNQVITPVLEDIENLSNSEGGDNLSLMFKVLKRGDKLNAAIKNQEFDSLSDIGLRYDLTVPLSRYYANNKSKLVSPMKCIQIGNAYRAENPQRGRYREFIQCDIDIVGLDSCWAEIELIVITATALMNIGISDFRVRINDRQILKIKAVLVAISAICTIMSPTPD
jgi:histidyl-tRNA synthetase